MNLCWVEPGVKLSSFSNILVESFATQAAVGVTPAITPAVLSAQLRDLLVAELKAKGKNAVKDKLDLPTGAPYLVIKGNFAQINPGKRAVRYMIGFGAGRALVDVESKVTETGTGGTKLVAELGASATKSMGVWGGSSDKFLDDCLVRISRLISQYVLSN